MDRHKSQDKEKSLSVSGWAWTISIALHAVSLGVFGFITLGGNAAQPQQQAAPQARIVETIKAMADSEPVTPKPRIVENLTVSIASQAQSKAWTPSTETTIDYGQFSPEKTDFDSLASRSLPVSDVSVRQASTSHIEFFGNSTSERMVCFVVDSSGSMKGLFFKVARELSESINSLEPDQYFNVIFFGGESLKELERSKLLRAMPANKLRALEFIKSVKPEGKTDALRAIKCALALKGPKGSSPATVYFLTDGFELSSGPAKSFIEQVLSARKQLAPGTRINTIGFWVQQADKPVLEAIARGTGGKCTIIH
jgi:hypothetical protein